MVSLMAMETLKKQIRAIDLAVTAGKKRQSPRTGFVHLYPQDESSDTIPIYENFCFAFALIRQKTAESVQEGKAIVEKLLAFQVDGNLPLYLHEYPKCNDHQVGLRVAPILIYLLRGFAPVLGELKGKIERSLQAILAKRPEKLFWENRYRACVGEPLLEIDTTHFTALEWTDWIITSQLGGTNHFVLPYEANLQLLCVPAIVQEKQEPRPNPIEWILAEADFSTRLLNDHPHQLLAAPLFPFTIEPNVQNSPFFWKGKDVLHSLFTKGFVFDLKEGPELGRNDLFEASLFCNMSPETKIFVEGNRSNTFQFGQKITIETPEKTIEVRFELTSGSGDFFGHIFKSNRPNQTALKGVHQYDAFDWHIGMRTLRRSDTATIRLIVS